MTAATTWGLGPPRERAPSPLPIVASTAAPTREVTLSRSQRRLMLTETRACPEREVGGALLGRSTSTWHKTIALCEARPPGRSSRRYRSSFVFDLDELEASEHGDLRCVGFWHSHPAGGVGLSPADLTTFARMRAEWDTTRYAPQFVALIVTPDERDGWTKPQLHGWRMWHENHGRWNERVAYEPVTLRFWGNEPERLPKPTIEVWDDAARRRHLLDMGIGAVDRTGRPVAS